MGVGARTRGAGAAPLAEAIRAGLGFAWICGLARGPAATKAVRRAGAAGTTRKAPARADDHPARTGRRSVGVPGFARAARGLDAELPIFDAQDRRTANHRADRHGEPDRRGTWRLHNISAYHDFAPNRRKARAAPHVAASSGAVFVDPSGLEVPPLASPTEPPDAVVPRARALRRHLPRLHRRRDHGGADRWGRSGRRARPPLRPSALQGRSRSFS